MYTIFSIADPGLESYSIKACSKYFLEDSWNNQNQPVFNLHNICDLASIQFGYDNFVDYLNEDVSFIWKELAIVEKQEPGPEWTIECEKNHQENSGAWILLFKNDITIEKWRLANELSQRSKLTGIISMKICTMVLDGTVTSKSVTSSIQGIWFYCDPSNNEKNIKEIGKNILDHMEYSADSGYMYYYSKKDTYKLDVPNSHPFLKGLILLEAQERFAKSFANKIEIYGELLKSISHQKEVPYDTNLHLRCLKLHQKDLNIAYEELCKRWNDAPVEYQTNMTIEYMTQKFDSLHHFMHYEMIESLKHFSIVSKHSLMWKKMFDDFTVKFWCRDCNRKNKLCQKCRSGYFSLPADRIAHILEKANIEFVHKSRCDDISIEELRITKVILFDEAKASYPVFDQNAFNYKMKTINQVMKNRLGDVLGENSEVTVIPEKEDKFTKMKQRKEAKKVRAEKKVKVVVVEEDQAKPYDFEKVLEALGEVN